MPVAPRPRTARPRSPLEQPQPQQPLLSPILLKRRPKLNSTRRRPIPRVDPHSEPIPHVFDQLPWISALHSTPDYTNNPWDIADLSQLPTSSTTTLSNSSPSGPGPVRRRKLSPRSSPSTVASTLPPPNMPPVDPHTSTRSFRDTPSATLSHPRTPPPQFSPSRVLFRHLMPVLADNDELERCTFMPPFQLR